MFSPNPFINSTVLIYGTPLLFFILRYCCCYLGPIAFAGLSILPDQSYFVSKSPKHIHFEHQLASLKTQLSTITLDSNFLQFNILSRKIKKIEIAIEREKKLAQKELSNTMHAYQLFLKLPLSSLFFKSVYYLILGFICFQYAIRPLILPDSHFSDQYFVVRKGPQIVGLLESDAVSGHLYSILRFPFSEKEQYIPVGILGWYICSFTVSEIFYSLWMLL